MRSKCFRIGATCIGSILAILNSGCAREPIRTSGCVDIAAPIVDCRPYPIPIPVPPVAAGAPIFGEDAVRLEHGDFATIAAANQWIIVHLRSTRAAAEHFVRCIELHNEHVADLNAEYAARCSRGEKKPDD